MDLAWSAEDRAFRDDVKAFLAAELTEDMREAGRWMTSVYGDHQASLAWQKKLHARGWAAPSWPKRYGGAEWSAREWNAHSGREALFWLAAEACLRL